MGVPLASVAGMLARKLPFAVLAAFAIVASACTGETASGDEQAAGDESEVKVDTRAPAARRQYDANVAFAMGYAPRCTKSTSGRKRVLLTGFGRFMDVQSNATGLIINTLLPATAYPETFP